MQYKSPIRLLSLFLYKNESIETIDINILKKRFLAEFELRNDTILHTFHGGFSKEELYQISQTKLEFHIIIYNLPALNFFLENNQPQGRIPFNQEVYKNTEFVKFLSPYLAHSLGVYYAKCIEGRLKPIRIISEKEIYLIENQKDILIQSVYNQVEMNLIELHLIQNSRYIIRKFKCILKLYSNSTMHTLNYLPVEYFSELSDTYAENGIELIYFLLNKKIKPVGTNKLIHFILGQLEKLILSFEMKKKVYSLKEQIESDDSTNIPEMYLLIISLSIVLYAIYNIIKLIFH